MMKVHDWGMLVAAIALLSSCTSSRPFAQSQSRESSAQVSTVAASTPFNNVPYATVLKTYVNEQGLVNYSALQANPGLLKNFNASFGKVSPNTYQTWSEAEKIAFLINAYNAFTLESIIDQKPLKKSIREIPGVWKGRRFLIVGESRTLDEIEHSILRKEFNEPRIHTALVCAAISCPPLRTEPYTGEKLNSQLDDQVQKWLSSHGLKIDRSQNRVELSAIFKWFGEDWQKTYAVKDKFTGNEKEQAVLNFVSHYVSADNRDYLTQGNYKIGYLDYNWALNSQ